MTSSHPPSQWENLLHNLGAWEGSFTRLSPQGAVIDDVPTQVTLESFNGNQSIRQTIQYFSEDRQAVVQEKVLEYSSLNRSVLVFENGAFCQGSMQYGPFSEFGAELGFIQGDRRLRLVQLFNKESQLSSFTLIREHQVGTDAVDRPALAVEMLLGEWQGEAVTLHLDGRSPTCYPTTLSLGMESDHLVQRLKTPQMEFTSTAQIEGSTLRFDQGTYPVQVLLLPDGASATTPLAIPRHCPFFLEAGWLIEDNLRQRMIRSYDAQGGWSSLTLVTERREKK
jgi:Domain of unknown function (DUF3598)